MLDSLQFLADIELFDKLSTSPQSLPQPLTSHMAPHKTSLPPASTARSTPPEEPNVVPPKRNPFMTAKEKYGAEVCCIVLVLIFVTTGREVI